MDLSKVFEALTKLASKKLSVTLVTLILLAHINADPIYITVVGGVYTLIQGVDDLIERRHPPALGTKAPALAPDPQ